MTWRPASHGAGAATSESSRQVLAIVRRAGVSGEARRSTARPYRGVGPWVSTRGMRSPTIVTLALVLASTPAAADGFLTLDRGDGESRGGVEASWAQLDPGFGDSLNVFRFDGHGHYVPPSGLGGYAAMSIAYGSNDAGSGTGIADAESACCTSGE